MSVKLKIALKVKTLNIAMNVVIIPCKQIKNLEKSYNTRYSVSLQANSNFVKENGLSEFMKEQKQKYTCPQCGGIISLHDCECSECGKTMDSTK